MAEKINNGSIADWSVSLDGVRQLAKAVVEMKQSLSRMYSLRSPEAKKTEIIGKVVPLSNNPDPGGLY